MSRKTYVAYMLRLWQVGSRDGQPVWRASLENPHTGERIAFGDASAMLAYLAERISSMPDTGAALAGPAGADDSASEPPPEGGLGEAP